MAGGSAFPAGDTSPLFRCGMLPGRGKFCDALLLLATYVISHCIFVSDTSSTGGQCSGRFFPGYEGGTLARLPVIRLPVREIAARGLG
jgi:hypothetical protein